jgi:hypothetical protein
MKSKGMNFPKTLKASDSQPEGLVSRTGLSQLETVLLLYWDPDISLVG